MDRQAILAVSFGTSHFDTLEKTIAAIEAELAAAFPERTLRRAFTSGMILRKLEKEGTHIDDVPQALERLAAEGYADVVVQPTHILNGDEYDKLMAQAAHPLPGGLPAGLRKAPADGGGGLPGAGRCPALRPAGPSEDAAVLYMGHGTGHYANAAYTQLEYLLHDLGRRDIVIGTVEGYPGFDEALRRLKERPGLRRVELRPLMVVAGDHANNDMAGPDADSWLSMFEASGSFDQVDTQIAGLGQIEAIQQLYVAHTAAVIGQ